MFESGITMMVVIVFSRSVDIIVDRFRIFTANRLATIPFNQHQIDRLFDTIV